MKLQKIFLTIAACMAFYAVTAQAQDQSSGSQSVKPMSPIPPVNSDGSRNSGKGPVPAARGLNTSYDTPVYDPAQVEPDTNTLSGAEIFGVGSLTRARNIFDPSLSVSALGASIPTGVGTQTAFGPEAILGGGLLFNRIWSRYNFTATYNGGENVSHNLPNQGQFHSLVLAQEIAWDRWRLRLRDDFITAPGATFAGTGMGGPGLVGQFSDVLGTSLNNIAQQFVPAQTIQTGLERRYENTALGEAGYSFSRRSAITFSGSYGLLRFADSGYISSHMVNAQVGYDHALDPANSIAVIGGYGKIDYSGSPNVNITDYTAMFAYGRKITGRLAFQAAAGPQRVQVQGSTNGNFQHWLESIKSALTYERRRDGLSLSYARGIAGGAGVYFGAASDTFTATVHRQFSRFWTGTVNGGYAYNKGLAPAGIATTSFSNWFAGGNVNRQLGHHAQVGFNYGVQKQNNPATCPVANCGGSTAQQTFGMTVNWHLRPIE